MKRAELILILGLLVALAACSAEAPATVATEAPPPAEPATAEPTVSEPTEAPAATMTTAPTEAPTATPPPPTATAEPTATPEPTDTPPQPTVAPTDSPAVPVAITIEDFMFTPGRQTVRLGQTVTWTHSGNARHTVSADDGAFDSGSLSNGGTFSFTFDTAGTYAYYCRLHGSPGGDGMSAVITVTE